MIRILDPSLRMEISFWGVTILEPDLAESKRPLLFWFEMLFAFAHCQARNIPLVIAGSFGDIFKRNSINNALLCLEVPLLLEKLRALYRDEERMLTKRTGWKIRWDVRNSLVTIQEGGGEKWEVKVGDLGGAVQELFVKGGLEGWVKSRL